MHYAINVPNGGAPGYADPRALVRMAVATEAAGWDGFFLWDHIMLGVDGPDVVDPWIALAAIAVSTERIRLGPMVTALPRRRPWVVARQATALDHLSSGRCVLGVGLGSPVEAEFEPFHEVSDLRTRAELLDESLAILAGLWSGEPFDFLGRHYRIQRATFRPVPLQHPRIPIWVGGTWPHRRPFRRAAAWDAAVPERGEGLSTDDVRGIAGYLAQHRPPASPPIDIVVSGQSHGSADARIATVEGYADAGATWWSEQVTPWRGPFDEMMKLIEKGPPRG